MYSKTTLLTLAAASAVQAGAPQGFNYGSTMNGVGRTYEQFSSDFKGAQALQGTPGTFNSARLYTMIDGVNPGSQTDPNPISALKAAVETKTQLLLGLWMSGAPSGYEMEINALKNAIKADYGKDLAPLVLGISVGSEDLYRISPTGLAAPDAAPGNGPEIIVEYIKKVRDSLKGTAWEKVPVGHVDTWTAWVNGSNSAVIDNSDFLGVDAYPYWQNTQANAVSNGKSLFNEAMDNTKGVSNGKPVWITETGWAVTGPTEGQAVAGDNEAQQYWDDVACPNLGNTPTFWYTLYDGVMNDPKTPSFSVANQTADGSFVPRFDLSCSGHTSNSTGTSSNSSSGSSTGSASMSTGTGSSSSGSGASNGTYTGAPSQPSSTGGSSSGSGSSSSGSGSGSGSGSSSSGAGSSSSGTSSNGSSISTTNAAGSLSISLGSAAAIAAAVVAFL